MEMFQIPELSDMNDRHTAQSGQTLVEAIIAIGVVVLLVTGLIAGTTASLKTSQSGRSRDQAVKLAEEGVEYARLLRDQSWSTLSSYSGMYCYDASAQIPLVATSTSSCDTKKTTADTVYTRLMTFSGSGNSKTVVSTVSFVENAKIQSVTLTTLLTQWK